MTTIRFILLLLLLSLVSGFVFPDYGAPFSFFVIPFGTPLIFGFICAVASWSKRIHVVLYLLIGWLALVVRGTLGTILYGLRTDWHYLKPGDESYDVIFFTFIIQTAVIVVSFFGIRYLKNWANSESA